jgi:hypothetical protein
MSDEVEQEKTSLTLSDKGVSRKAVCRTKASGKFQITLCEL